MKLKKHNSTSFSTFLLMLLAVFITSCEVFKTTPRSSPNYRGTGANKSTTTNKSNTNARSSTTTRTSQQNTRTSSNSRTTTNRNSSSTARTPTTTTSRSNTTNTSRSTNNTVNNKPLASRPTGTYDKNVPEVVQVARTYTGTPYRSGGNDRDGIDCSGLICQVYTELGVKVPRISWQQSEFGNEIEKIEDIKPGDWLFFVPEGGKEGYVSHSGIVTEVRGAKDIVFIHASTSRGVVEDNLFSNYFRNRFVKAMRPF